MKAWTRWQDWTVVLLSLWLLVAPSVLEHRGDDAAVATAYTMGTLILLVGLWALASPSSRGAEWSIATLGVLLAAAPFLLGFGDLAAPTWNAVLVGLGVASLGAWALYDQARPAAGPGPRAPAPHA
jgi:peptidoglycan/LPS O-acetylase OafA/YrhL